MGTVGQKRLPTMKLQDESDPKLRCSTTLLILATIQIPKFDRS
jgi:hypothetical protein